MLLEAAVAVEKLDQAIAFAQKGLDERDPLFVLLARLWPGYNPLRADARFLKMSVNSNFPIGTSNA